jgi:ABC-2 type transport system permease protein
MPSSISQFRRSELFKPAIIVPIVIMLFFSIFNLTAPSDPARIAYAFELGVVNKDIGPSLPLVSNQAIKHLVVFEYKADLLREVARFIVERKK